MRAFWGPITEVRDLGVVAEHCPYCARVWPCLLRSVCRGDYLFFLKLTTPTGESSCFCTSCHKAFACESWRYAAVVSCKEAKGLLLEDLEARSNPSLAERRQMKEQIVALGGDASFVTAYEQLESLRPGLMRSSMHNQLLTWGRLAENERALLGEQIVARARAWNFARQIAPGFPSKPGCLAVVLPALVIWSAFFWAPPTRSLLGSILTPAAGFFAAGLANYVLMTRSTRHWTRYVLVPEAHEANVSLDCFLAVVDDLPELRLGQLEDVWPLKSELQTIRGVLVSEGQN